MEKKKKPIEDEALDQVTGGDNGGQSTVECPNSPTGNHVFEQIGWGRFKCIHCPFEIGPLNIP